MQNDKFKNYLHLHVLVFIAGFTAILGALVTIKAIPLVWFRMCIATVLMFLYIKISGISLKINFISFLKLAFTGIIIALHWITFFGAINASNISITLAMLSTGAFFASFLEPIIFKRKIIGYEIIFGAIVILGVVVITQSEIQYLAGILLGLSAAFFSALFAVLNGSFLKTHKPSVISFYEFLSGVIFVSLYIMCLGEGFNADFFTLSQQDLFWIFILASICTAYAFIASVSIMKTISPYTVMLSYNLEPVYGIFMAVVLFPDKEKMSLSFYYGAIIIISVVLLNAFIKNRENLKRRAS